MWRLMVGGLVCLSFGWSVGETQAAIGIDYEYWGSRVELRLTTSFSTGSRVTVEQEGDQLKITEDFTYGPDTVQRVAMPNGWLTINANATGVTYITVKNIADINLESISVSGAHTFNVEDCVVESLYSWNPRIMNVKRSMIDRLTSNSEALYLEESVLGSVTHRGRMRASYRGTLFSIKDTNVASSCYVYGTNHNDDIRLNGLRGTSRSQTPEVKMYLYNGNDWVSARNSRARSLYIHGGSGSDSYKDEGGNNTPVRQPSTASIEYRK